MQRHRGTEKDMDRNRNIYRETNRETERGIQRERAAEKDTERQTEGQRETERERAAESAAETAAKTKKQKDGTHPNFDVRELRPLGAASCAHGEGQHVVGAARPPRRCAAPRGVRRRHRRAPPQQLRHLKP